MHLRDGTARIVNPGSGSVAPVCPASFSAESFFVINYVTGRGPTSLCAMSFSQPQNMWWSPTWGTYHDMWNAINTAANSVNSERRRGHVVARHRPHCGAKAIHPRLREVWSGRNQPAWHLEPAWQRMKCSCVCRFLLCRVSFVELKSKRQFASHMAHSKHKHKLAQVQF